MNPDLGHWLNYQYEDNRDFCIKSDLDITQKDKDYMDDLLPWLFEQLEPEQKYRPATHRHAVFEDSRG